MRSPCSFQPLHLSLIDIVFHAAHECRRAAIFTSTNEKMSGLGYKQYTHGKHEKPVLLANSEHEMQED